MKLRTFAVAALGAALLAGLTACAPDPPPPAPLAPSTVDQEATNFGNNQVCNLFGDATQRRRAGIGFVAGRTGDLDRVSLALTSVGPVTVQLQATDAVGWGVGYPNGTVLATGTFPGGEDQSAFSEIEFTTPARVEKSKKYAIVVSSSASACIWTAQGVLNFKPHLLVELSPDQWVFPAYSDQTLPAALFRTWVRTLDGLDTEQPAAPNLSCLTFSGRYPTGLNFTAGRTGQLYQLSLMFGPIFSNPQNPISFTIQTTEPDGAPSGNVIGSTVYAGPQAPDRLSWVDVPLTTPADVTAGTKYAVVISDTVATSCLFADTGTFPATGSWGDDGAGGWYFFTQSSYPLRTFVR